MRLQPALWSVGLLSAFCDAAVAPVYVSGDSASKHEAAALTFEDARLYLAQHLGLSHLYQADGASDAAIDVLGTASSSQTPLFSSAGGRENRRRRAVVIMDGVDASNDFLSSRTPAFRIESDFSEDATSNMVRYFLSQDHTNMRNSKVLCMERSTEIKEEQITQGGFSASDPLGLFELDNIEGESWWQRMSIKQQLALIDAPSSEIAKTVYSNAGQSQEADDMTGVFYLRTLHNLAARHGTSSPVYKTALNEVSYALDTMLSGKMSDVTVVLLPYTKSSASKAKRGAAPVSPPRRRQTGQPSGPPRTTIPTCYSDQSACEAATANCSSHGSCVLRYTETETVDEKGAECWGCACAVSVLTEPDANGRGGRTISWGGPACQKKDVSVPFWLFAGFGIFIASAVSYGVGMLYSIGQSDLPSVLGAGVASVGSRPK